MSRILYHYWRSSCSWRVRWALALKGLSYEPQAVNLLTASQTGEDYLALNPMGQVPFYVTEGGQGLGDSMAIMEYLEEVHAEPRLMPTSAVHRAKVRQLCQIVVSGTQPIQNLSVMRAAADTPEGQKAWNRKWIHKGLAAYEKAIQSTAGKYSLADELTLADVCLVPQCYNALRVGLPLEEYPRIKGIYERCRALPSCVEAEPESFDPSK